MTTITIVVVLTVLVLAAVVATVVLVGRRNARLKEVRLEQAGQLRGQAQRQGGSIAEARQRAEAAEEEARVAQMQADRARERAEAARHEATVAEAHQEDALREADQLDPDRAATPAPVTGSPTDLPGGPEGATPAAGTATGAPATSAPSATSATAPAFPPKPEGSDRPGMAPVEPGTQPAPGRRAAPVGETEPAAAPDAGQGRHRSP
ncbi:hypothetical protein [Nocardioides sp. Leaf374]|uniref:hypothetical protein n=1 Tax=Nocardioides sp. Leaf374 TaxID=2876560 RepID=UPI001E542291|nr:hypothetical protein [Nocardioides sp. Leaf374]